jgi:hypothetical protein
MDAGTSPARQPRVKHRHELHTLTYVTLDQANGGIVRNLSHEGVGVQVVAGVRPRQQLRVRFELRDPRLRVESRGEVMWATRSGQCGIRFLDLSPEVTQQIDEWIFGSLLEAAAGHSERTEPMFAGTPFGEAVLAESLTLPAFDEDDGLMVSATPLKVIELPARPQPPVSMRDEVAEIAVNGVAGDQLTEEQPREYPALRDERRDERRDELRDEVFRDQSRELDWLSRPLSGPSLVWTINILVALAALLLVVLVFLSVTGEPPRWPLAMLGGAAVSVAGLYWGFFHLFAGASPGARLARMVGTDSEEDEVGGARFR